jgi:hypothetical protein
MNDERIEGLALNEKGKGIGRGSKKKLQRQQLILAMLQQPTWQKAAASIGISEVTAWRIRQTPEFRQEYLETRREAFSQSLGRLQQGSCAAVSTLLKIMVDPNNSASSRVQAASRILDYGKDAFVSEDLELRFHRLEQMLQEQKGDEERAA